MATISPGKYYIVPALKITNSTNDAESNLALHLYWGWTGNGTTVNLKYLDYKDYELWEVSSLGGDLMRITSCLAGRCLDVESGNLNAGTNVQIYDSNGTNAQKWIATATGGSTEVDHVSYPTYYIRLAANQNLVLDVEGAKSESSANVIIWDYLGQDNQKWAFVPWQLFHSEGTYEIRSMLNTGLCIDVPFGTKNAETQLQLYACNHGDNQKWVFKDMYNPPNDTGWRITNVASGLVIDAYNGEEKNGTRVQQYPDNSGTNQRWLLIDHGTTVVEGYDCKMVSFGVKNREDYVIDAPSGSASGGNALQLYESNGTDAQLWALYPTKKSADSLVVPTNCGISKAIGEDPTSYVYWDGSTSSIVYPCWSCPDSWLSGQNHFQIRYRKCFYSPVNSAWTNWQGESTSESITQWKDITVSVSDGKAWLADGIDMQYTYDNDDTSKIYSNCQLYFEVRCVVQSSEQILYGNANSGTGYLSFIPTVSLSEAQITSAGLVLTAKSNFIYGPTFVKLDQITQTIDGKDTQLFKTGISGVINLYNGTGSSTFPRSRLTTLSPQGVVKMHYVAGLSPAVSLTANSEFVKWSNTVSLSLGPGNYVPTVSLTVGSQERRTLFASVSKIGTEQLWIVLDNDTRYEVAKNSDGLFEVPYPFGKDFQIEVLCYNSDVSKWGSTTLNIPSTNSLVSKYTPCHSFSTIDSDAKIGETILCLELRLNEAPVTSGSISMDYEALSLAGRDYQTVSFSSVKKKTWSVEGVLLLKHPTNYIEADAWDRFTPDILSDQLKHCIYRAPNGEEYTVAVSSISYTSHSDVVTLITGGQYKGYTEISVSLIRESY